MPSHQAPSTTSEDMRRTERQGPGDAPHRLGEPGAGGEHLEQVLQRVVLTPRMSLRATGSEDFQLERHPDSRCARHAPQDVGSHLPLRRWRVRRGGPPQPPPAPRARSPFGAKLAATVPRQMPLRPGTIPEIPLSDLITPLGVPIPQG